jgi:GMP synthase (glutamine-hydrolysing)
MADSFRFLVAESESPRARSARRDSVGRSSGESYIDTIRALAPGASCDLIRPAEDGASPLQAGTCEAYDAVFLTGSPLHVYQDTPETRRQIEFMRAVFASGTPSFGSCAGLQVAAAAAGGTAAPNRRGREMGIARGITPTEAGRSHPLLTGRPPAYDAAAVHSDEVDTLPPDALLLAGNAVTPVQAAEIRFDKGVFWGVQYHPELPLFEIAAAVRRQADDIIAAGLSRSHAAVEAYATKLDLLDRDPGRRDIGWELGLGAEVTDPVRRQRELRNFIEHLVKPTRSARSRG